MVRPDQWDVLTRAFRGYQHRGAYIWERASFVRENVCDLVVSADASKLDVAAQALVSYEMVEFSYVLGPLVMDGVLRNLDTRFVVLHDRNASNRKDTAARSQETPSLECMVQ